MQFCGPKLANTGGKPYAVNESSQPPSSIIQCGLFVQSTYCASTYSNTQNNKARNELSIQYAQYL